MDSSKRVFIAELQSECLNMHKLFLTLSDVLVIFRKTIYMDRFQANPTPYDDLKGYVIDVLAGDKVYSNILILDNINYICGLIATEHCISWLTFHIYRLTFLYYVLPLHLYWSIKVLVMGLIQYFLVMYNAKTLVSFNETLI